jgi:2-iminobutanoate/2-iminopropanoate deaminase
MKTIVDIADAPRSAFYSQAVLVGGWLFISGMTGTNARTGAPAGSTAGEQTSAAIRNCQRILESVGATLEHVVETQVLLADPRDFDEMNASYAACFPLGAPARSVAKLGVRLPGILVSIRMTAIIAGLRID